MDDTTARLLAEIEILTLKIAELEGRVDVIEERTCDHESRLEDLEQWQEKVDDHLDCIDDEL